MKMWGSKSKKKTKRLDIGRQLAVLATEYFH